MNEALIVSQVLMWLAMIMVLVLVFGHTYDIAKLRLQLGDESGALQPIKGLELGDDAPPLEGLDVRTGKLVAVPTKSDRQWVAVFLTPNCGPCVQLVQPLNRLAKREHDLPIVAVVKDGPGYDFGTGLVRRIMVLRDVEDKMIKAYQASQTPIVYLVSTEGKVLQKTISNRLTDLEDTLDGRVHPQGPAQWVHWESEAKDAAEPQDKG